IFLHSLCLLHLSFCLFFYVLDGSHVKECTFRILIHLSVNDGRKAADRFLKRYIFSRSARKYFRHREGLRQESLYLSCTVYCHLILFRQFFHTKDRDNVLKFFIFLQNLLYLSCHPVMLFSNHVRFQDPGGGFQRIYRRIDSLLHDLSGKNGGGIQMEEYSGMRCVSQVVSWHIC